MSAALEPELSDTLKETQDKLRRSFRVAFNGKEPGEFEESMINLASPRLTEGQPFHWTKKGNQPFLRFGLPEEQGDNALLESDLLNVNAENVNQALLFAKEPDKDLITRVNAREAQYCRLRSQGLSQANACMSAGYNPSNPRSAAVIGHEIEKRPHVKAYLNSLRTAIWRANAISADERRAFLADIVRTPVGEVTENSPLCQSYKVDNEGKVEYKMPDKLKALELDAKLAGELREQAQVSATFNFAMLGQEVPAADIVEVEPEKQDLPE